MRLRLIRHLWGVSRPWAETFPAFRELGFQGIESALPPPERRAAFRAELDAHGFDLIPQIFTAGDGPEAHIASFRAQVAEALPLRPLMINAHSGSDQWPLAVAEAFFRELARIERDLPVPVAHETHRARCLFNLRDTLALLQALPDLRLCADFSHWVVVAERLLSDRLDDFRRIAGRVIHVHARVGYEHGPQVPDPRAPEYARHLAAHEAWWDLIWDAQQTDGCAETSLTPEFGPPGYLHTLPYTEAPVADLWAVCHWMAARQAERFARRGGAVA